LVGLVEQNKSIETHKVGNLQTTNQLRTHNMCDVILSRSVRVFRSFGRKRSILFAIPWCRWTEPLTALICHLLT